MSLTLPPDFEKLPADLRKRLMAFFDEIASIGVEAHFNMRTYTTEDYPELDGQTHININLYLTDKKEPATP